MRNIFSETIYQEAIKNDRIYIVVADISPVGSMARFREEFPERFINVGVSEQSMIGICAGLALKGMQPFAYTIANFALYRPFEFVRNDLAYHNLPVTVVGMGAGLSYADHGGTHHTIEDVAIASCIPNMQVISPCDPYETAMATEWCAKQRSGPVYLRLGKSGEPILNGVNEWGFGSLRRIHTFHYGSRVTVLSYGPITKLAYDVAETIGAQLFSCHTLKPLDKKNLSNLLISAGRIVCIEEHVMRGGLSQQVKALAWDIGAGCRIDAFTLQDEFIHRNGKRDDILAAHGLSLENILSQLAR